MAFMVPLVKNHYDIYARNNPADHPAPPNSSSGARRPSDNSLYLSATSLAKKGAHPVTKQYRIVISGGKVVGGAKSSAGQKIKQSSTGNLTQSGAGKIYYKMPSASITLPVPVNQKLCAATTGAPVTASKPLQAKPPKVPASTEGNSPPQSVSPPSRPLPHLRRTVRNPLTNRVYSYSVSIPDYVAEEDEEDLEDSDSEDEELDFDDLIDGEDKENEDSLLLFSTSAPAGTGPLSQSPSPPPGGPKLSKKNQKKQPTQQTATSIPSSPEAGGGVIQCGRTPRTTQRTLSTASTNSSSNSTNSREYIELLRKFILHLKMLKIGGSGKKRRNGAKKNSGAQLNNNNNVDPLEEFQEQKLSTRTRKRKDTMEDSNHL